VAQLFSLGHFTFMKTYRVLGILWMIFCGFTGLVLLWPVLHPVIPFPSPVFILFSLTCVLYLAGSVAGYFLFRGAQWARWFIALLAILFVVNCISKIAASESVSMWSSILFGMFWLVSLVLLLLPRHEPVA